MNRRLLHNQIILEFTLLQRNSLRSLLEKDEFNLPKRSKLAAGKALNTIVSKRENVCLIQNY